MPKPKGTLHLMGTNSEPVAVLISGGLDSSILVAELIKKNRRVYPLYIQNGNIWERAERFWLSRFLRSLKNKRLEKLVRLSLPVKDIYGSFWSVNGRNVPDARDRDEACYLPGRNFLLITKAAIYCARNGVAKLALGPLKTNPFPDAKREFFDLFEQTLCAGLGFPIKILTPFLTLTKNEVMKKGVGLPLDLTFSCLKPRGYRHCGICNKCAERKEAFANASLADPTPYAA